SLNQKIRGTGVWVPTMPGGPAPHDDAVPVTVGSYNILCASCSGATPWSQRGVAVADRVKETGVNLAILQEVMGRDSDNTGQLYERIVNTFNTRLPGTWDINSDQPYADGAQG